MELFESFKTVKDSRGTANKGMIVLIFCFLPSVQLFMHDLLHL